MPVPFLPILLLALPLAEIAGFVIVGREIGALATIGLVLATSVLGGVLLRIQGFGALSRIRAATEGGGSPGRELVHGVMIMFAVFLLLLPGFITDIVGILLFLPPVREAAWRLIQGRVTIVGSTGGTASGMWRPRTRDTIDLDTDDYSRDDRTPPSRPAIDDDRR